MARGTDSRVMHAHGNEPTQADLPLHLESFAPPRATSCFPVGKGTGRRKAGRNPLISFSRIFRYFPYCQTRLGRFSFRPPQAARPCEQSNTLSQ